MSLIIKAWWVRVKVSKIEIKLESWFIYQKCKWFNKEEIIFELIKALKFVISSMFAAKSKFLKKENLVHSLKSWIATIYVEEDFIEETFAKLLWNFICKYLYQYLNSLKWSFIIIFLFQI